MEIRKIMNIFKKKTKISLFCGHGVQWITDGVAVYPLWKLPLFDDQSLAAAYDLPGSVKVELSDHAPTICDLSDAVAGERQVFCEKIQLQPYGGTKLLSLFTSKGVSFIDKQYLDPIEDDGYISLYERLTKDGKVYIVVKRGMMLEAVIMPVVRVLTPDFLDDLQELTSRLISTYNAEKEEE